MELIGAIALVIGIVAGVVQVLDYLEKRREKADSLQRPKFTDKSSRVGGIFKKLRRVKNHNLPSPLTSLIGRNQEVSTAVEFLEHEEIRLVTLTGPGGIGKTRLSIEIAFKLLDSFEDGVFFVQLENLREHTLVVSTVAQTLSVKEVGEQSVSDRVIEYLHGKRVLLVLDNFEHLMEAGPELTTLLLRCPGLSLLVTSRSRLHLTGEYELEVPPLVVPDFDDLPACDELAQYEAIQLFVERARATRPDFTLTDENSHAVARICACLDGLPLAIELAAARIKIISPNGILERLDDKLALLTMGRADSPKRQQTLEATIAWSYELLDRWEQELFTGLSVFVGGGTLQAIEAVTVVTDGERSIFNGLVSLVEKNLLEHHEQSENGPRFWMLNTIREYGLRCLSRCWQAQDIYRRHAEFFLNSAIQAEANLSGKGQLVWLNRLDQEHDNLRAALEWFITQGQEEKSLRMVSALGLFWLTRDYLAEGRIWLERVLTASSDEFGTPKAKALASAALIVETQGDFVRSRILHERSLELFERDGDKQGMASTLNYLGLLHLYRGEYERSRSVAKEALALYENLGNKSGVAHSLEVLGYSSLFTGKSGQAQTCFADSLNLFRQVGDRRGVVMSLEGLGHVAKFEREYDRANSLYQESMLVSEELGWRTRLAIGYANLGEINLFQSRLKKSGGFCDRSLALFQEFNNRRGVGRVSLLLGSIAIESGEYKSAEQLYRSGLSIFIEIEDTRYIAKSLFGIGEVLRAEGYIEEAVKVFVAGNQILGSIDAVLTPFDRSRFEQGLHLINSELGNDAFESMWSDYDSMASGSVVELARTIQDDLDVDKPPQKAVAS